MSAPRPRVDAVALCFFANGFALAAWLPRLPGLRDDLGLSDTGVGLVLLCAGLGGLVASGLAGRVVRRLGSRTTSVAATALLGIQLALLAHAPGPVALGAALFGFGLADAWADVAMNAQAGRLQARSNRSVVNRIHAVWSLGTVIGGALAAGLAGAGVSATWHFGVVGASVAVAGWVAGLGLDPEPDPRDRDRPARGGARPALALALVAVTVAVFEGFSADWGAIVVTDRFDASPGVAGTAFVAFTAAMFCGRLAADHVIDRVGPVRVVRGGAGFGAVGLAWITVAPGPGWAVVGFFVVGLGAAPVFPLLYRAATELATTAAGAGLGLMSAGARIGFLTAPAVIGVVADATRPTTALVLVVGPALVVLAANAGRFAPPARGADA